MCSENPREICALKCIRFAWHCTFDFTPFDPPGGPRARDSLNILFSKCFGTWQQIHTIALTFLKAPTEEFGIVWYKPIRFLKG